MPQSVPRRSVLDAVGALVLRDLLEADTFETLIGPWRELDAPTEADYGDPRESRQLSRGNPAAWPGRGR